MLSFEHVERYWIYVGGTVDIKNDKTRNGRRSVGLTRKATLGLSVPQRLIPPMCRFIAIGFGGCRCLMRDLYDEDAASAWDEGYFSQAR